MFDKLWKAIGLPRTSPAELAINVALVVSAILTVGAFVNALSPLYDGYTALLGALLAVAIYELPAFAWNQTLFHDASGKEQRGLAITGALFGLLLSALSSGWYALAVFRVEMDAAAHVRADWFMPISLGLSIFVHGALKLAYTYNDDENKVRDAEREFSRAERLAELKMQTDRVTAETQLKQELQGSRLTKARDAALKQEAKTGGEVARILGEAQLSKVDEQVGYRNNGMAHNAEAPAGPKPKAAQPQ